MSNKFIDFNIRVSKDEVARTIKVLKQTGKMPNIPVDKSRLALQPGKRVSKTGKTYWETRKNRSDVSKAKKL